MKKKKLYTEVGRKVLAMASMGLVPGITMGGHEGQEGRVGQAELWPSMQITITRIVTFIAAI